MAFPKEIAKSVANQMKLHTEGWAALCYQGLDREGNHYYCMPTWNNEYPPLYIHRDHFQFLFCTKHLDAIMGGHIPFLKEPESG